MTGQDAMGTRNIVASEAAVILQALEHTVEGGLGDPGAMLLSEGNHV